jgi:diguanylate cyclase (GGDEF)-like protein
MAGLGGGWRLLEGAREIWAPSDPRFAAVEPAGELARARLRTLVAFVFVGLVIADNLGARRSLRALAVAGVAVLVAAALQLATVRCDCSRLGLVGTVVDVTLISASFWLLGAGSVQRGLLLPLQLTALAAAALRLEWRLCVVGGALAGLEYTAVVALSREGLGQPQRELAHLLALLLGAGVLAQLAGRARLLHGVSMLDMATGVLSHSAFERAFSGEVTRSKRHGHELTLALVEIDHSERLVRSFGSARAEAALRSAGGTLRRALRRSDTVARTGGAEFGVLLPETEAEAALSRFDQLRLLVASDSRGGTEPDAQAGVTVSIAVAGWPGDGSEPRELLAIARSRLAEARAAGGDRVVGPPSLESPAAPVRH